jgi:hypothetical protein
MRWRWLRTSFGFSANVDATDTKVVGMKTVRHHNGVLAMLLVAAFGIAVGSCAPATGVAIMSSSAGAAAGAGIERTMGGKQHKTFVEPIGDVETAARDVLDRMAFTLDEAKDKEDGRTFKASADKRQIDIELERLTPRTTRLSIVAKRHTALFPDHATATEIIMQIAKTLENGTKGAVSSASSGADAGSQR